MKFAPDYGLKLLSMGASPDITLHLTPFYLDHITIFDPYRFTTMRLMDLEGEQHALSLDLDVAILQAIVNICPDHIAEMIFKHVDEYPAHGQTIDLPELVPLFIKAKMGELQVGNGDAFRPFIVQNVQAFGVEKCPNEDEKIEHNIVSDAIYILDQALLRDRLSKRDTRALAVVDVCENRYLQYLPEVMKMLLHLTWEEVGIVKEKISLLGSEAVPYLCLLLDSERKQTAEVVTFALGAIGDAAASAPLMAMMESQASQANAIRARDALMKIGDGAVPTLIIAVRSKNWQVRYYAVQALGVIGHRAAVDSIVRAMSDDRSEKVRDAAMEALQNMPFAKRD